jgi:hypothetical protein
MPGQSSSPAPAGAGAQSRFAREIERRILQAERLCRLPSSAVDRAQRATLLAGLPVNEAGARNQLAQLKGQWLASQEEFLQSLNAGGGPNRLGENLLGLEGAGYSPNTITDSAIVDLAEARALDGGSTVGEEQPRPPITESSIARTARAIRALRA